MPLTELLPCCVAELEFAIRAIHGQTFAHGFKQGVIEAVEGRKLGLQLLERCQLPVEVVGIALD